MRDDHDQASGSLAGASGTDDPLSSVLRTVKLTGALYFVTNASTPWGFEVPEAGRFAATILPRAQHVISYHIIMRGSGWLRGPDGTPRPFSAGDILLLPHEDAYAMMSSPDAPLEYTAEEAVAFLCAMAAGELPFVVTEGGGGSGGAQFVCGFLGCDARPFNPLLAALPRLMHVTRGKAACADLLDGLVDLALAEVRRERAGGACLRLGLSELMFIEVVRRYLETLPADGTGWLAGLRDQAVGRALTLIHARPAEPWTLAALAGAAGVSRSVLAARFAELIGMGPMHYLARWRIQLAARRLADGDSKVAAVGAEVGYESEAAFSRAFRRLTGMAPAEWRRRAS